ncbi:hypothetical protein BBJ28_00002016 [Nothophytophthora sp. Chile5]|nr:hypothetical protein BBJ28_00002016 [Nothophytophthora sp. Chile5]
MATASAPGAALSAAEQAEAEAQRAWELEMEQAVQGRGRTRSRSILADDPDDEPAASVDRRRRGDDSEASSGLEMAAAEEARRSRSRCFSSREADADADADEADDGGRSRRRSCSFSALEPPGGAALARHAGGEGDSHDLDALAKRAASLSKIYLAGSAPVDVSKLQDDSKIVGVKKVEVVQPTGALSAKALDALSEGLQLSVDNSPMPAASYNDHLTEEQLEEKKMEEEEDHKLKAEKLSTRKSLSVRASLFKSKMFKSTSRLLGAPEDDIASRNGSRPPTGSKQTAAATEKQASEMADAAPVVPKKRHKLKLLLLGDSGTHTDSPYPMERLLWFGWRGDDPDSTGGFMICSGVGKTSLMRVFSGDEFSESMLATAGVDFKLRHISVADEEIALQIWDTAGQERFHRITASTCEDGAKRVIYVGYWMNNIRQYSSPNQMPAMLLVGNKIDLPNRVVSSEEETSAKTSENTNGALETIARDAFLMSVNRKCCSQRSVILLGELEC